MRFHFLTSPFKYKQSNANTATRTVISSSLTSLRLRVLSTWKGKILDSTLSQATASQSKMNDVVVGLIHYDFKLSTYTSLVIYYIEITLLIAFIISGYLTDMSSEFLLYILMVPSSKRWIYNMNVNNLKETCR